MAPEHSAAEEGPPAPGEVEEALRGLPFRRVTAQDDPILDDYRNLKDRDWARKDEGLFVVEGEMCVRNLLMHNRFPLQSLLLSERRAVALGEELRRASCLGEGTVILVAAQPLLDSIVGFPIHRGVLAIGRRGKVAASAASILAGLAPAATRVVLAEKTSNLDNVGALFRNAAALGASAVLFDSESSDPLYRKSLRVSGGHALAIPWCRAGTGPEMVKAAQAAGFTVAALTPAKDAVDIRQWWPRPRKVAVLMGAEGPGLGPEMQALADVRVQIPMATNVDSLNVATAAAVALAELAPERRRPADGCFAGCTVA